MTGVLDRDPLLREVAGLRDRVDVLEETVRQLRDAMTPSVPFPAEWQLTVQEAQLLHGLRRLRGHVLTRERAMIWLYGFEYDAEIKIIDVLVCRIRKKVRRFGVEIKTRWGEGHALTLPSLPILASAVESPALARAA